MAKAECDRIMTMNCLANLTQRTGEPEAHTRASVPEGFRRLKRNEVVWSGDFVADERLGLQLWAGREFSEPARLRDQFTRRKRPKDSDPPQPENQNKTQNIMAKLLKIAETKDVPRGQAAAFTVEGQKVALFNVEGTYYAIGDTCTHRGGPLSEGDVQGTEVTCPWHGAHFDLKTGAVLGPPAQKGVPSYKVTVEGDDIKVAV